MKTTDDTSYPKGSTPVPDPTLLTTQQLLLAVAALKELVFTRLDGMDKAMELFNANITRVPTDTDKQIEHLKTLHEQKFEGLDITLNERFSGVEKQFIERDVRGDKIAELNQKALDAALQAAKEAAGKTELSFTKQIADLTEQFKTQNGALGARLDDLKGRFDRGEGSGAGRQESQQESKGQQNWFVGLFVIGGLTAISIVVAIVALLQH